MMDGEFAAAEVRDVEVPFRTDRQVGLVLETDAYGAAEPFQGIDQGVPENGDLEMGRRILLEPGLPMLTAVLGNSDHDVGTPAGIRSARILAGRINTSPDDIQVAVIGIQRARG